MKKILSLILISILCTGVQCCFARTLNCDEIKLGIKNATIKQSQVYTDAQLEVKVLSLPFQTLNVPDGKITYVAQSNSNKFLARDVKKISIYADNNLVKTFVAPVSINAYKNVLVAKTKISPSSEITSSNTDMKRVDVANILEYCITNNNLTKMSAKKFFNENEIIDKRFIVAKPDVQKNSTVSAYFNSNQVVIEIEAFALSDGMIGDYIILENKAYKKRYQGKVIGKNKVLIQI